jgi:hypothetical protein
MKRFIILIAAVRIQFITGAQAQINTKKVKIEDFTQKITKVVLTGNIFYDSSMEDEIAARWRVSPYEFCSVQEFEQLKGNSEYYFLLTTKGRFKKETEPGLQFLTLVKGGEKAEGGIDDMLEIVSLPIASVEDPSGRETVFLPAFLDIIQNYAADSMEKDINAYTGLSNYSLNLAETKGIPVIFAQEDLSTEITDMVKQQTFDEMMSVTDEEGADRMMTDDKERAAVSYVAVPTEATPGSYCYKMLIDNQTHKLYYFKKHRITKKTGAGFLAEDLRRILSFRTK